MHKKTVAAAATPGARKSWTQPVVSDLPMLVDLTLQSAGGAPPSGDAVTVTGGSSGLVF